LSLLAFLLILAVSAHARDFYWENPTILRQADTRFPQSASNGTVSVLAWQEIQTASDGASGTLWLSALVNDGSGWITRERFAGPIPWAAEVPSVYALLVDRRGRIIVPTVTGIRQITVYISADLGATFIPHSLAADTENILAPHIHQRSDGGFLLFASRGDQDRFVMVHSRSNDGILWEPFQEFGPARGLTRAFLPTHVATDSGDLVVFQAFYQASTRPTFQLYSTVSTDGGRSWSQTRLLTSFNEPGAPAAIASFDGWHNQRPRMVRLPTGIGLFWERGRTGVERYRIYFAPLDSGGTLTGPVEAVSSADGFCFDPVPLVLEGQPAVVWFDNRRGANRIYLAVKQGFIWSEYDLSRSNIESVFGRPVLVDGVLEVFWQQAAPGGTFRVVRLAPDRTVLPPEITGVGYTMGTRTRADRVVFSIRLPADSSDIGGYSWAWSPGTRPTVPAELQALPGANRVQVDADADGSWFLGVRVLDYAGNWSEPSFAEFIRDTTPPGRPNVLGPPTDASGFLSSNTFTFEWKAPPDDDVAGYTWSLEYLASPDQISLAAGGTNAFALGRPETISAAFAPRRPPSELRTRETRTGFTNRDNGLYAFSVSAIDRVGNIGEPAVYFIALNKFIPFTLVHTVESQLDDAGVLRLSIIGRGFTDGGTITTVHLDRDGKSPWDISLTDRDRRFTIQGDRLISGIQVPDLEEGEYRIALVHPDRGLYRVPQAIRVTATGTVKYGDFSYTFSPAWQRTPTGEKPVIRVQQVGLATLMLFALVSVVFSVSGLAGTARDAALIRAEVQSLLKGDIMPLEKKHGSRLLKSRGLSLRFKLAFFTTTLVIAVTLLVSIPLGLQFSQNQERTLASGLESRVFVLLESLASGARAYLPSQNLLELGFLPAQIAALDEAQWATITGLPAGGVNINTDFVWASNDPDLESKLDTATFTPGLSRLSDGATAQIAERSTVLDEQARRSVSELAEGIDQLTREGLSLALRTDAQSVRRVEDIQATARQLEQRLNRELWALSNQGLGSWPEFDPENISRTQTIYIFYKPVLYRRGTEQNYVRGSVRLQISTETLLESLDRDRRNLILTTVYTALFAVLMGVLGALILASIIISPVRKLATHVAMIRDTEDKANLEGKDIKLRSRDEIGLLGETINDMTLGLVKAALANRDLTVGKELQKMFIPLQTDSSGRKLTTGFSGDDTADFFGYYEGAKGVSGDYFDYIKLDQRHYAIIKCDIAGKGVPAALIMVEVATLFLDYFKDWSYQKNGFKIDYIVSRINDLIESRGFKGRFAAFTLCIFDSVSGDVHFCNAGDNLVHWYDASDKKMKILTLPQTSAAGVFPSFMVEMKGGFRVVKHRLEPGDILFLYTDGIEEAKRLFRDQKLKPIECAHEGLPRETPHESHSVGQESEELGLDRVHAIYEAVIARKTFTLVKYHNPEPDELFDFDFSTCDGGLQDVVFAVMSVEKIFRMYRDPATTEFDRVQVDRKIDVFLNKHFRQYDLYCAQRRDHPEYPEYLYYTHVREDEQYDDLTILAIRKK